MAVNIPTWAYLFVLAFILVVIVICGSAYHFTAKAQPKIPASAAAPIPMINEGYEDKVVLDTSKGTNSCPYTTDPINNLDQYELESVFDSEGDKQLSKAQINKMTRQYPLDWSNQPPSSSKFQSGQAKYIDSYSAKSSADKLDTAYQAIGDGNLRPPDTIGMERQEKEILQTYTPLKANDLTTYDIDDADALMRKIYRPKGLIPTVVHKEGNVFEVVNTRQIKNKIEYEDELPETLASSNPNPAAGEALIHIPAVATETAAGLDPFYEPTTATRSDRSDYTKWTPGLERMFAPTHKITDWVGQPQQSTPTN
jgi:hypothetical protein